LQNGRLKVLSQVSFGGLSAVYLCQKNDQELVVLKEAVVPGDGTGDVKSKALELFEREAQILMKLDHPQIMKVLDHFVDSERHYLLLEYHNGQDLKQFVKHNGCPSEEKVCAWALEIAIILEYLHEQDPPIIHRDLTPDNLVLATDGSIVMIDFGAANEFVGKATGTLVGKQSFIAPEQFRGKATTQSDLYALGCTLHFLLTGQEPVPLSVSHPKKVNLAVSTRMDSLVSSLTAMNIEDRIGSATELKDLLVEAPLLTS
jgi:serine/threonine-protein kinase